MNKEWSELNKCMQEQLRKEQSFKDGIETLLVLRGNIVTKWNTLSGMSLGMFIFTADDNNDDLIPYAGGTKQELIAYASRITVHEYGHTIQPMLLGPFMLIPGIISVAWGSMKRYERLRNEYGVPYTFCWVESWASRLGEKYTGKKAIW